MTYHFTKNRILPYDNFIGKAGGMLELKIDTKNPIEVRDFGAVLNSVASQYDEFVTETYGKQETDARFYIQEVKKGSIIVEFAAVSIGLMDQGIILKQFLEITKGHVGTYLGVPNNAISKKTTPAKGDHIAKMVQAVANSEDGNLSLAYKETSADGAEAALIVTKSDAQEILTNVFQNPNHIDAAHLVDAVDDTTKARVLMRLYQHNQDPKAAAKKRTNHKAIVRDIDNKPRPMAYEQNVTARELAEIVSDYPYAQIVFDVTITLVREAGVLRSYRLNEIHNWHMEDEELVD